MDGDSGIGRAVAMLVTREDADCGIVWDLAEQRLDKKWHSACTVAR
jgi:hypothetical protein